MTSPNEAQMVALQDIEAVNGPDHVSLGPIKMGESFTTNTVYVEHLRDYNLACLASEFGEVESLANQQLKEFDILLKQAEGGENDNSDDPDSEQIPITIPAKKGGRPARAK